jgi:hypothetical protein
MADFFRRLVQTSGSFVFSWSQVMTHRPLALLTACVVFAFGTFQTANAQQVYRWVDDKGIVHYSDTPPPEKKGLERVNVRASGAAKLTPEEQAAAEAAEKTNLLALNSGNEVDGDFGGIRRPLTPEERQEQIEKNQTVVDRDCVAGAESE